MRGEAAEREGKHITVEGPSPHARGSSCVQRQLELSGALPHRFCYRTEVVASFASESTANVARGAGVDESRIVVVDDRRRERYGDFAVTLIRSAHLPMENGGPPIPGTIDVPLVPPAPIGAWKEGGSYSIVIEHPAGTAVVQGSAGYLEGGSRASRRTSSISGSAASAYRAGTTPGRTSRRSSGPPAPAARARSTGTTSTGRSARCPPCGSRRHGGRFRLGARVRGGRRPAGRARDVAVRAGGGCVCGVRLKGPGWAPVSMAPPGGARVETPCCCSPGRSGSGSGARAWRGGCSRTARAHTAHRFGYGYWLRLEMDGDGDLWEPRRGLPTTAHPIALMARNNPVAPGCHACGGPAEHVSAMQLRPPVGCCRIVWAERLSDVFGKATADRSRPFGDERSRLSSRVLPSWRRRPTRCIGRFFF